MLMCERSNAVAVIMSVYGGDTPEHLALSLSSIFDQDIASKRAIHLYLGVDGPISSSVDAVIQAWEDRIYCLKRFRENRGLAHVLNDLIKCLDVEEFVFRMDADDVSLPGRFSAQVAFMESEPGVGICGTAIYEGVAGDFRRVISYPAAHVEAVSALRWRSPFAHPTVCFRRHALELVKNYPTDAANEDIALWFKAAAMGIRFANLEDPLVNFRISDGFWKRRGFSKALGELRCYWRGLKLLQAPASHYYWPIVRFIFRLSPVFIRRVGYQSQLRHLILR